MEVNCQVAAPCVGAYFEVSQSPLSSTFLSLSSTIARRLQSQMNEVVEVVADPKGIQWNTIYLLASPDVTIVQARCEYV